MGMPVNEFTEQAYVQLAAGSSHVMVGSVAASSEEEFEDLVKRRDASIDKLNALVLSRLPL